MKKIKQTHKYELFWCLCFVMRKSVTVHLLVALPQLVPHCKCPRNIDEVAHILSQLFKVAVFGLIPHCPVSDQRSKPTMFVYVCIHCVSLAALHWLASNISQPTMHMHHTYTITASQYSILPYNEAWHVDHVVHLWDDTTIWV